MDKKEREAPSQRKKAAKLLAPQTLKWIVPLSFLSGLLFFGCTFVVVSGGIVANIPTAPVYVEPAVSMSSIIGLVLVGVVGTIGSAIVFMAAGVALAVQSLRKSQPDIASQSGGKEK